MITTKKYTLNADNSAVISARIPNSQIEALKDICAETNQSISFVLREIIEYYLEKEKEL